VSQDRTEAAPSTTPTYVLTDEAARIVGLSRRTLANRRSLGMAPRYFRAHGRVLYDLADLHAFLAAGLVERSA
jgi:hypothetical protein